MAWSREKWVLGALQGQKMHWSLSSMTSWGLDVGSRALFVLLDGFNQVPVWTVCKGWASREPFGGVPPLVEWEGLAAEGPGETEPLEHPKPPPISLKGYIKAAACRTGFGVLEQRIENGPLSSPVLCLHARCLAEVEGEKQAKT